MLDPRWATDHQDVIDYLTEHRNSRNAFLKDVAAKLRLHGRLTVAQVDAVRANIDKDTERTAAEIAFRAQAEPHPTGKNIPMTGTILGVTGKRNPRSGETHHRMLIHVDPGRWRAWGTVPAAILRDAYGQPRPYDQIRGLRVRMVAEVRADEGGDPFVGQFKYPKQVEVLGSQPTNDANSAGSGAASESSTTSENSID